MVGIVIGIVVSVVTSIKYKLLTTTRNVMADLDSVPLREQEQDKGDGPEEGTVDTNAKFERRFRHVSKWQAS